MDTDKMAKAMARWWQVLTKKEKKKKKISFVSVVKNN